MHTRQFRKALANAGFSVIKDRKSANVVIAHSAGIYAIPVHSAATLLMLIGPTYWPGQPLIKRMVRHTRTSRRYHVTNFGWRYYLWKKSLEVYYFFRRHIYMWHGIRNNNRLARLNQLISLPGRRTIIVRNKDDPFSSPELKQKIKNKNMRFIELPGVHDDYVTNPKPYIDLLLKEV